MVSILDFLRVRLDNEETARSADEDSIKHGLQLVTLLHHWCVLAVHKLAVKVHDHAKAAGARGAQGQGDCWALKK